MKNEELILKIEALGTNAEGIARDGGRTVFTPFCLPGEVVEAKITGEKKGAANAVLKKIVSGVNGRIAPVCKVFKKCGGCQLQHMGEKMQSDFKTALVKNNLKKIAKIDFDVPQVLAGEKRFAYRNKLQIPAGQSGSRVITGFFKPESHEIAETDKCPLHGEWADKLLITVREFASECKISAYDESTKQGLLRHIVARFLDNQLLVTIVINGDELPQKQKLVEMLKAEFQKFGLFFNMNKRDTNVILGETDKHIYGLEFIESEFSGVKFRLGQKSFFQINEEVAAKIYDEVKEQLNGGDTDIIIDAFSGIGVLSAILAKTGKQVYAVEIVKEAVEDAEAIKKLNGITNLTFIQGDANEELQNICRENAGKKIALVVDPPRKGLDKRTVETILESLPHKVIYISCDSATLARDLKLLSAFYQLTSCQPYDMFPQTRHVETLVCLTKKM